MLIIGVGWGYHVPFLLRSLTDNDIIFYEPVFQISEHLKSGRLQELRNLGAEIFTKSDDLIKRLKKHSQSINIFFLPQYKRLFSDIETRVREALSGISDVGRSTITRFFPTWTRNFFSLISENKSLDFLLGFKQIPTHCRSILYCGAGPGLFDELKDYNKSRFKSGETIVVASDSALAPLLSLDIKPHLIISIDSGPGTAYHFQAAWRLAAYEKLNYSLLSDIPILTWMAGPRILSRYFDKIYYYRSTFPFDQIIGNGPLKKVPLWKNDSSNMIGLALIFAEQARFQTLFTAGASFLARKGYTHIRGTGYTIFPLSRTNRTFALESYRPRGYEEHLTLKNEVALKGLGKMSSYLNIEIRPLESHSLPEEKGNEWESLSIQELFQTETITTESLRNYLKMVWNEIRFNELESDLPDENKNKCYRLISSR